MTAPHDRPTAAELVEAVREWLENDVLSSVDGRLQFHTRVAINSLNIVQREFELGVEQQNRHAHVLSDMGVASDTELASKIRDGQFDERLFEVLETLAPVIEDKVRVANPKYLR